MGFTAVFDRVPERYIAFVEEPPGAKKRGAALEEVRENPKEAISSVLEANRALAEKPIQGHQVPLKSGLPHSRAMKRRNLVRHLERHGYELFRRRRPAPRVRKRHSG